MLFFLFATLVTAQDILQNNLASLNCSIPIPDTFSKNAQFTILCPPTEIIDAELAKYHFIPGRLDNEQLAEPRQQSIAYSLYQDQALVVETAPNLGSFLIRGADWNATSLPSNKTSGNTFIQPISKASSPFSKTDARPCSCPSSLPKFCASRCTRPPPPRPTG